MRPLPQLKVALASFGLALSPQPGVPARVPWVEWGWGRSHRSRVQIFPPARSEDHSWSVGVPGLVLSIGPCMLHTDISAEPMSPPDITVPPGTTTHWMLTATPLPSLLSPPTACSHSSPTRKRTSAHLAQPPPPLHLLHILPGPHNSLFQGPGLQDGPQGPTLPAGPCRSDEVLPPAHTAPVTPDETCSFPWL